MQEKNKKSLSVFIQFLCLSHAAATTNASANSTAPTFILPETTNNSTQLVVTITPLRLRDCHEYLVAGFKATGAYKIHPNGPSSDGFYVYCDMDTDGGGWTIIQSRSNRGTYRDSFAADANYSKTFGSTCGDFWIGTEELAAITSRKDQQVMFSYVVWQQPCAYCQWTRIGHSGSFKEFWIERNGDIEQLHLSGFYGGDSGNLNVWNGNQFLTQNTWQQYCPNKTFLSAGWYNTTTCQTPYNLFIPLACGSSQGICSVEIKIRNPMGSILLDGELTSYSTVQALLKTFQSTPRDCGEILLTGNIASGAYKIFPDRLPNKFVYVYCDMVTEGGGWTTILQRGKYLVQQESFDSGWNEYEKGFGSTCADQWIGFSNAYTLSSAQKNELRIVVTDWDGKEAYANYYNFSLGSHEELYSLRVSNYSGNAGDSLTMHSGAAFSTKDKDSDKWTEGNCAASYGGGWWFVNCLNSNLNGNYLNKTSFSYGRGLIWSSWKGFNYSMKSVEMKIRNVNFNTLKKLVSLV